MKLVKVTLDMYIAVNERITTKRLFDRIEAMVAGERKWPSEVRARVEHDGDKLPSLLFKPKSRRNEKETV